MPKVMTPLLQQEIVANNGYTHEIRLTADHLTEAAAATAQTIKVCDMADGDIVSITETRLLTPFEDKSDATFNSTTLSFGDAGSATRFVNAAQINLHGTEIADPVYNNTAYQYTAAGELRLTIGSMAAKSLKEIDKGELIIHLKIVETKKLADLHGSVAVIK